MNDSSTPDDNSSACGSGNEAAVCCSQFYEQDIVQELMGGSFHPGGAQLSRNLISQLNLPPQARVLDVACGVGTTTRMMAEEFGLQATGLDYSQINISKAVAALDTPTASSQDACCEPGQTCCSPAEPMTQLNGDNTPAVGRIEFVQGSADALPTQPGSFDGVTCECAVSTFADQPGVAQQFFNALKSGGVLGMTDMVVNDQLPADFAEKAAPWTCVAKALSMAGYQSLFESVGFKTIVTQDHSAGLLQLATDMKRKLVMAGMGKALGALPSLGLSIAEMRSMLAQSTDLVKAGTIQYGLLVFQKP